MLNAAYRQWDSLVRRVKNNICYFLNIVALLLRAESSLQKNDEVCAFKKFQH